MDQETKEALEKQFQFIKQLSDLFDDLAYELAEHKVDNEKIKVRADELLHRVFELEKRLNLLIYGK